MSKSNKTKTALKAPCLVKRSKKELRTLTLNIELEYTTCVSNFVAEKVIKALLEDEEFTDGNIKVKKIDILSLSSKIDLIFFDDIDTDSTIIWILLGVVLLCIAFFLILVYNYPSNNAGAAHKDCYMNVTSVYTPYNVNGTNYTAITNITHAGFCMSA